jgi:hypothetical protein
MATAKPVKKAAKKAAPKAVIHFIEGNHECLHPDHEVLTERGWIPIADVTTEDVVATMLPEGTTAWQKPTHVHTFDFSGEMVKDAFWIGKECKKIADYCEQDVLALASCYLKMKGITNQLTK